MEVTEEGEEKERGVTKVVDTEMESIRIHIKKVASLFSFSDYSKLRVSFFLFQNLLIDGLTNNV